MKKILLLLIVLSFLTLGCSQLENYVGFAGYQGKLTLGCPATNTFGCISGEYYYAYNEHPNGVDWYDFVGPLQQCNNINSKTCWCPLKGSQQVEEVNIFFSGDSKGTNFEGVEYEYCVEARGARGLVPHPDCTDEPFYYAFNRESDNTWGRLNGPITGCTSINSNTAWCARKEGLLKTKLFINGGTQGQDWDQCAAIKGRVDTTPTTRGVTRGSTSREPITFEQAISREDLSLGDRYPSEQRYLQRLLDENSNKFCIEKGCFDSDAEPLNNPDGSSYYTKGQVMKKVPYNDQHKEVGKEPHFEGNNAYTCNIVSDYCKSNKILIEQVCNIQQYQNQYFAAPGTKAKVCECGCSQGVCKPCIFPDLVVDQIPSNAASEKCANSFTALICNKGNGPVEKEFKVTITANKVTRTYLFPKSKLNELTPGGCSLIKAPQLFHIGGYGLSLNQKAKVDVEVDTDSDVLEKLEFNNKKSQEVSTGTDYFYDEKTVCDAFCYDMDAGFKPHEFGPLTYQYSGLVGEEKDICHHDLYSWHAGEHTLREYLCLDIIMKSNKKLSNPLSHGKYDCLQQKPFSKCEKGKCVPLKVLCQDSYGNQVPCLKCVDYEGKSNAQQKDYKNLDKYQNTKGNNVIDPFTAGKIDYTTLDNKKSVETDFCLDSETLRDLSCSQGNAGTYVYSEKEYNDYSCYDLKTSDGKGHICDKGKCVPTDIDKEKCEGPTEKKLDVFKASKVTETKLLGETKTSTDYCYNQDIVTEYYCDGKKRKEKQTNCDFIKDKKGMGASCVAGACVFFDASKEKCTELGDVGADFKKDGNVKYVTGYGLQGYNDDKCKNEDLLIETYCSNNKPKFVDISCKKEGLTCVSGACKAKNEKLKTCTEQDDKGTDPKKKGYVEGVNEFGEKFHDQDWCKGDQKTLVEFSCDGKSVKKEEIKCKEGESCFKGACRSKDANNAWCKEDDTGKDTYKGSKIEWSNQYGIIGLSGDHCKGIALKEWYCDGKEAKSEIINCKKDEKCVENQCSKPDESKKSCKVKSFGYAIPINTGSGSSGGGGSSSGGSDSIIGVEVSDKYGEKSTKFSGCKDKKTFVKWTCNEKEAKPIKIACKKGEECVKDACRKYDPKQIKCSEFGDKGLDSKVFGKVRAVNEWGITNEFFDSCKNSKQEYAGVSNGESVLEWQCLNGKESSKEIKCKEGEWCVYGVCRKEDKSQVQCLKVVDKGLDITKKGIGFSIDKYGILDFESDECDSPDEVDEMYCKDNKLNEDEYQCKKGTLCSEVTGTCVPVKSENSKCIELSDKGIDSDVFGITIDKEKGEFPDYCESDTMLWEWECTNNGVKKKEINCKDQGKVCLNGACRKNDKSSYTCTEYLDKGYDTSKRGIVVQTEFWETFALDDRCDDNILKEFACEGKEIKEKKIDCSKQGKTCSEGRCV